MIFISSFIKADLNILEQNGQTISDLFLWALSSIEDLACLHRFLLNGYSQSNSSWNVPKLHSKLFIKTKKRCKFTETWKIKTGRVYNAWVMVGTGVSLTSRTMKHYEKNNWWSPLTSSLQQMKYCFLKKKIGRYIISSPLTAWKYGDSRSVSNRTLDSHPYDIKCCFLRSQLSLLLSLQFLF